MRFNYKKEETNTRKNPWINAKPLFSAIMIKSSFSSHILQAVLQFFACAVLLQSFFNSPCGTEQHTHTHSTQPGQ